MTKNNYLKYTEKVNLNKAKYLYKLDHDTLISEMYDPQEVNEDGHAWSVDTYIKQLKRFLKRIILKGGTLQQKYKYSSRLGNCGRIYVKGFGIQSLQAKIRGFLCDGIYKDYDMKNAHPTILKYVLKEHFNYESKLLNSYINKRQQYLDKYKCNKKQILICMNSDKIMKSSNILINDIDKEFKKIQKLLWEKEDFYPEYKDDKKRNKKGSFLNTICCIYENNILQKIAENEKLAVPMFDGFFLDQFDEGIEIDSDEIVKTLNKYTEEYGIIWDKKEHNKDINIDEDLLLTDDNPSDYFGMKLQFEDQFFMIEEPLMFGKESEKDHYFYNKADFNTLTTDWSYSVMDEEGGFQDKPFFIEWLKDKNKRKYKRVDFLPNFNIEDIPENIYNTFKGFEVEADSDEIEADIQYFLDHLLLLSNSNIEVQQYLIKYLAHMIQKPQELPEVAILLRSQQGVGKDALIDFMEKIIGQDYVYRTENCEDLFGSFNPCLKNKLIIQLNELQGKDGFHNKEKIKNLITTKRVNINEKGIKQYSLTNYSRLFIFSNNLTPIEIPADDRRWMVIKCGNPKNREYYNKLYKLYNDEAFIQSLYSYFKNYELKKFDPKTERVITDVYQSMQEQQTHPLYKYLLENFNSQNEYKNTFSKYIIHKKTNNILITSSVFYESFNSYLHYKKQLYFKHDFKTIKLLLSDIDVIHKSIKVKGEVRPYYIINQNKLIEVLKNKGIQEEEIEEIFSDEFDEFSEVEEENELDQ